MYTLHYLRQNKISLGKALNLLKHPSYIRRYLKGPKPLDAVAALVHLGLAGSDEALAYRREYREGSADFWNDLNSRMMAVRGRMPKWPIWPEFLYMIVRAVKPEVMIETGPFDGQSTSLTLLAMKRNQKGKLISVDLPARQSQEAATSEMPETTLPQGKESAWLVPHDLRDRFELRIGDSKRILPRLLSELGEIDIFFHDSLHTYEHMYFEFCLALPYLKPRGLVVSDDILWTDAFKQFCDEQNLDYVMVGGFGATRLP